MEYLILPQGKGYYADACVQCGHCETRCPSHVKQESRMKEIDAYFQQ